MRNVLIALVVAPLTAVAQDFAKALDRTPDDIKVVIQFSKA